MCVLNYINKKYIKILYTYIKSRHTHNVSIEKYIYKSINIVRIQKVYIPIKDGKESWVSSHHRTLQDGSVSLVVSVIKCLFDEP